MMETSSTPPLLTDDVFNDNMSGGAGTDWFCALLPAEDVLTDRLASEQLN